MAEHDQLFKRAFRIPEHAAGELRAVLPAEVLEEVDLDSLELLPSDHVDQRLTERISDARFRANFDGVPGYLWLLLEHQSTPDHWLVLRVLEYEIRGWLELIRQEPQRRTLPPVLCVVVHHGEGGWTAPVRFHEVVEGLLDRPALRPFVPDFRLIVDDLVTRSDEELQQRPLPRFPKLVLWALRDARTIARLHASLCAWADELDRLARESEEDSTTVLNYILTVTGPEEFDPFRRHLAELAPTTEVRMANMIEHLLEQGKAEGLAVGKAEGLAVGKAEGLAVGKAEGLAAGKADAILKVLEARGVPLSSEQRVRILDCREPDQLERWLQAAATATAADELFPH